MKKISNAVCMSLTLSFILTQACSSRPSAPKLAEEPKAVEQPAENFAVAGGAAGSIQVKVAFSGTVPVMPKLKRESDPFCAQTTMNDQSVTVNANSTLKNVAVRITSGAAPLATPPVESVIVIDQNNCMYIPRVVTVVKDQKVVIRNSDPVLHNIHGYTGTATLFNQAQFKGAKDLEKSFSEVGVAKLKCDVHPWMTGWAVVTDNGFACVTDENGVCTLNNIPAGTYTVEAWHEVYGAKTMEIIVGTGEAKTADFAFSAQ